MHKPAISICLPCLNSRRFLEERMQCIFSQTYQDWELIVCDSYSNDGTWEYLQPFASDPRIRLYQVPKEGLYAGWNECLKRAQGKYVYFATADDTADDTLLSVLRLQLEAHPTIGICACLCDKIDKCSALIKGKPTIYDQIIKLLGCGHIIQTDSKLELALMALCGPTWGSVTRLLYRKSLFDDVGYFPTGFGSSGDWAWSLKAAAKTGLIHVPQPLATWRIHSGQASASWSLDGCKTYNRIFTDFIKMNREGLQLSHQWSDSIIDQLVSFAWLRYESDADWFMTYILSRPAHFVRRARTIYQMDTHLLKKRLSAGLQYVDDRHLKDPQLGLEHLEAINIGKQNVAFLDHQNATPGIS